MAKLGSVLHYSSGGQSDVRVSLCSLGVVLCMVVVLLGIKLRWFKKRIHFDQLPSGSNTSGENVVLRRSSRNSQEHFCEPVVAQGTFRKKLDEDIIIERPKILPPVRVRKTSNGALSFGPRKKNTLPPPIIEEPVVTPPPPPPLPSASSLSLAAMASSSLGTLKEDKVNFDPVVQIISSDEENNSTYEPLSSEDEHINRQISERKQTGYVRPSDEIIAELQKLSDETFEEEHISRKLSERKQTGYVRPSDEIIAELQRLSDEATAAQKSNEEKPEIHPRTISTNTEFHNSNGEIPAIKPRTTIPDKPKEKFRKNISNTGKAIAERQKSEESQNEGRKLGHRRLTGVFPSPDDNFAQSNDTETEWKPSKVVFQVDDDDYERSTPSPPLVSPPMLFSSQISNEDEFSTDDSWSAIERHRNLTKEINEQQEISTKNDHGSSLPEFHNPTDQQQHKDIKRNNARTDLLLTGERD